MPGEKIASKGSRGLSFFYHYKRHTKYTETRQSKKKEMLALLSQSFDFISYILKQDFKFFWMLRFINFINPLYFPITCQFCETVYKPTHSAASEHAAWPYWIKAGQFCGSKIKQNSFKRLQGSVFNVRIPAGRANKRRRRWQLARDDKTKLQKRTSHRTDTSWQRMCLLHGNGIWVISPWAAWMMFAAIHHRGRRNGGRQSRSRLGHSGELITRPINLWFDPCESTSRPQNYTHASLIQR